MQQKFATRSTNVFRIKVHPTCAFRSKIEHFKLICINWLNINMFILNIFHYFRLRGYYKLQIWARYLEGDNISTKIGSGRVEIEIGMAISTYPDTSGKIEMAILTYPEVSGHVGMPYPKFSLIFPGHFRSEKNRENRGKSG